MAGLYYRRSEHGSNRGHDIQELINDFSLYEFCSSAKEGDHGAFLAITNKQYIIGYNVGFGDASHDVTIAKVMKELHGGGEVFNEKDAINLCIAFDRKYISARICYEIMGGAFSHTKEKEGYMIFDFTCRTIPRSQYEMFLEFYNDYHEEVELVCKKFNFNIHLRYRDNNGKLNEITSKNLEVVKEYMTNNIVEDEIDIDDEVIINKKFGRSR